MIPKCPSFGCHVLNSSIVTVFGWCSGGRECWWGKEEKVSTNYPKWNLMIYLYLTILAKGYCPSQQHSVIKHCLLCYWCLLSCLESREFVVLKLGNWACRKEKDPLKPKHPTTAFFAFSNSRRPALLEDKKPVIEVPTLLFVNFVVDFHASTNVCAFPVLLCWFWTLFEYLGFIWVDCHLHLSYYLSYILKNLNVTAD